MKVTLFISRAENQPGHYLVVVNGEGFFESVNRSVGARIRGDDPWFDDRLFSIGGTGIERVGPDGSFSLSRIVSGSQLNEDWGRDEIYALVDVEGLSGTFKSNTVVGHF
ncbi:MAG TPA: hypothetical protein VNL92_04890, partial [Dehalococcoidia bacterium]|nr:hypothetical protein [Dehalococcoidia bacterium]